MTTTSRLDLPLRRRRATPGTSPVPATTLASSAGRPVVVMAHGLAGTKDSGLRAVRRRTGEAGLDVLAFDYRGFGASDAPAGSPRQVVSMAGQLEDYRAAMAAAARLPGVDPRRLVLWGVSLAGGHVLAAAAHREDVAAVVSLTPLVDGLAAGRHAMAHHKPSAMLRSTVAGVRSRVGSQVLMPVVAAPGELGALTLPGAQEDYLDRHPDLAQRGRRRRRAGLGGHRPGREAKHVRAPLLVQIADFDRSAPPSTPPPRPPSRPAPRCVITCVTTSTCGRARTGSSPRWSTRWRSCGGTWAAGGLLAVTRCSRQLPARCNGLLVQRTSLVTT